MVGTTATVDRLVTICLLRLSEPEGGKPLRMRRRRRRREGGGGGGGGGRGEEEEEEEEEEEGVSHQQHLAWC